MKVIVCFFGTLLASFLRATPELQESHTLSPIEDEWLYVRASEASTLFINEHDKGKETICAIIEKDTGIYFTETSQGETRSYEIDKIEKDDRTYNIYYKGKDFAARSLIYPFRDVDETWVLIHFIHESENPVHFLTLASNKNSIPYLKE